jgi:hypothetical protein
MTPKVYRIELSPATDEWMMGDRYATVLSNTFDNRGRPILRVQLDKSNRIIKVYAHDVTFL